MFTAIVAVVVFVSAGNAAARDLAAGDEAAILQVTRDACKAFVDADTKRLTEVLTEDFTLTDADGTVTTRAQEIASVETGAVRYEIFENHDMKVRAYGDSAVVTGRTTVKGTAGTSAFAAEFQFTDAIVRRDGRWRFAASHISRVPSPSPDITAVEAELKRLTQENLDAIAPGLVEVWRRNLHDKVTHVDENGAVRNKTELLAEFTPLPKGLIGRLKVDKFKVTLEGNVAVATHEDLEHLEYHGQLLVSRWRSTDTWLKTAAGWKLLAEQTLAILEDPPAIQLTASQLCAYAGTYQLTPEITDTIRCANGRLTGTRTGRPEVTYQPEVLDVFFAAGRPRTRRIFLRDATGAITGFVDRREGIDVRWSKKH
jgi:ketosteroid isomerase-like protein